MTIPRALMIWLLMCLVAVINGALRDFTYSTWLGKLTADQVFSGWLIAAFTTVVWLASRVWPFRSRRQAVHVGILWMTLTIVLEFGFGRLTMGYPWSHLIGDHAIWNGRPWILVLISLLLLPLSMWRLDQWREHGKPAIAAGILWAFVVWIICGLSIMLVRAVAGTESALRVHLVVAPLASVAATLRYRRDRRHLAAFPTAILFLLVPVIMDALLVAPFLERSFEMFRSLIGTWAPLALIFAGSLVAGALPKRVLRP